MNLRVSFKSKAAEKIAKGLLVRAFNRSRQDGLKMQQEIEGRVHKIHKWAEEDRPLIEKFDAENAG
ncbi:MAG: hypothetical protein MRY79_00645, partial [Alphaproteobacteria bacterium]|nr:hypothetical protein [Alphaproteobacteria bacterium]